jgi:HemY protein
MRTIGTLLVIAALVAAAVFADNPGRVAIVWQGWQIETSVGILVAAAVVAAVAVMLLVWLLLRVVGSPRTYMRWRRERRRRAGYQALTRGMVAVAAGDPEEARRYARRAEVLLAEPPLTLLLSAQAAQLGGDETAAKKFFTTMLDRHETEFLGLRGLLNQALREGDRSTARGLAERAAALSPKTRWAVLSLFDLEVRDGRWEAARDTLVEAVKHRVIAPTTARHHRGVIVYELSLAALARGNRERAAALAAEAQKLAPDLAPAAAHRARLLLKDQRARRAANAIERAWQTAPHPQLAQVYGTVRDGETPLARVARFERLAARNPGARESHIALAEAALAAQLWGEARRHLERALAADQPPAAPIPANPVPVNPVPALPIPAAEESARPAAPAIGAGPVKDRPGPSVQLCLMMAQLEEAEHGDLARTREWLDRAARAVPDPRYVCTNCGGQSLDWRSLCPRCSAFDTFAWRTPVWAASDGLADDGGLAWVLAEPPPSALPITETRDA